ncbi:kinase-like domain-containing protein [Rhizophagus clarus]|uniref:Kinase-like domain-containing protein n=1 Tax=Rhizophagus clarus TaxID=94130 RepID=A0A8H3QXR3_9GLOM|nr:kinase-like domain-containing protein [Rhizophagus clarus]
MEFLIEYFVDLAAAKKIIEENFTNWTSGNEIIDNFIQEKQLKYNRDDAVFEWIPYSELIDIKEIGNNCLTTAVWKKGPLYCKNEWIRESYEDVVLRFLHDTQNINDVLEKVESYLLYKKRYKAHKYKCYNYGISQDPNTKVYILVFSNAYLYYYCKKCGNEYERKYGNEYFTFCKTCIIDYLKNNLTSWTSGNGKIDKLIQEKQLEYGKNGTVFKWIPYNEFIDVEEIENSCLATAIWKEGSLHYDKNENEFVRISYKKVILRFLQNTDEVRSYTFQNIEWSNEYYKHKWNKWCKPCQINHLKNNFSNWTSGDKNINDFIRKKQLKTERCDDIIFEWIPYNEFFEIKEMDVDGFATAIWKDGPLIYNENSNKLIRKSYKPVCLKYLHDNINNSFLKNEIKPYLKYHKVKVYGLSQNTNTKVYILVLSEAYFNYCCEKCGKKCKIDIKRCKSCLINHLKINFINRTSGKKEIDIFIQKMQLEINDFYDTVFEWIPYNEFIEIEEMDGTRFATAIWKDGPLFHGKLIRRPYEKVYLKHLRDSLNITNKLLKKEVESYYKYSSNVYGLSQHPDTRVYILIFKNEYFNKYCEKCGNYYIYNRFCELCQINHLKNNFINWTSGIEKIDDFIQKMQLKIVEFDDIVFEWIPYDNFIDTKEIGKDAFTTAIWKDGPLYYSIRNNKYERKSNKKVLLKCLYNSQNVNNSFLNQITYSANESYGLSQNPNTKDFILVLQLKYYCENCGKKYDNQFEIQNKSCIVCQINHENDKINDLIQEMRLKIDYNYDSNKYGIIFEWIPYDQFDDIKEIGKGGFSTVYSAIWKDGLLHYDNRSEKWKRKSIKVALKCLYDSQNFLDNFINEVKAYPNQKIDNILKIYGISQNLDTKNYIMVLEYAEGGNFNNYLEKNHESFDWFSGLEVLNNIFEGLNKIHQKQMVHRDFHIGNILFTKISNFIEDKYEVYDNACISDMGLCRKIDDINEKSIYGVMPYVAPECWEPNPDNRPNCIEIKELIDLFYHSLDQNFEEKRQQHYEIEKQFNETQECRKESLLSIKNSHLTTHKQAIYTSRLLNPFTENLSRCDDNINNSTVEITDFTNL